MKGAKKRPAPPPPHPLQESIPQDPVLRLAALQLGQWPESPLHVCLCCILKVMEKLVKRDSGSGGFTSLMSAVLEKQTLSATAVWQLLLTVQETKTCPLNRLMEEIRREPGAEAFFRAGGLPTPVVPLPPGGCCQSRRKIERALLR